MLKVSERFSDIEFIIYYNSKRKPNAYQNTEETVKKTLCRYKIRHSSCSVLICGHGETDRVFFLSAVLNSVLAKDKFFGEGNTLLLRPPLSGEITNIQWKHNKNLAAE